MFSKKLTSFSFFSRTKQAKIKKPFAHVKKVLTECYKPSKKDSSGDINPLREFSRFIFVEGRHTVDSHIRNHLL